MESVAGIRAVLLVLLAWEGLFMKILRLADLMSTASEEMVKEADVWVVMEQDGDKLL